VPERVDLGKERADQATDYVNYVFLERVGRLLRPGLGHLRWLLLGNGVIKFWWDQKPEYKTETHRGLSEDQLAMVLQDVPEEDILGHSARADDGAAGQAGQGAPYGAGDVRPGGLQPAGPAAAVGAAPGDAGGPGPVWSMELMERHRASMVRSGASMAFYNAVPHFQWPSSTTSRFVASSAPESSALRHSHPKTS
jgi:hypothetical protein